MAKFDKTKSMVEIAVNTLKKTANKTFIHC